MLYSTNLDSAACVFSVSLRNVKHPQLQQAPGNNSPDPEQTFRLASSVADPDLHCRIREERWAAGGVGADEAVARLLLCHTLLLLACGPNVMMLLCGHACKP